MRLKYVIHRSKKPFALQKELFRKIINFYMPQYPGLTFVDKGLRFSAVRGDSFIDFDFGYLNMRYRDFSAYHAVISQGAFAILDNELNPGDIALPSQSDMLRINNDQTKVRLYKRTARFDNLMNPMMSELGSFEKGINAHKVQQFVAATVCGGDESTVGMLGDVKFKDNAHFVESNTFFVPSKLKTSSGLLKDGEARIPVPNLKQHLQENFHGLNCETKQMIENVGDRLAMFSVGLDKPYSGIELTNNIRFTEDPGKELETYNTANVTYFLTLLMGYLLEHDFKVPQEV